MNQMEIFKNPEFGSIRVVEENGRYLFCGTDVAAALGYSNPRDALRRHCKGVVKRDTLTDGGHLFPKETFTALSSIAVCPRRSGLSGGYSMRYCPPSADRGRTLRRKCSGRQPPRRRP